MQMGDLSLPEYQGENSRRAPVQRGSVGFAAAILIAQGLPAGLVLALAVAPGVRVRWRAPVAALAALGLVWSYGAIRLATAPAGPAGGAGVPLCHWRTTGS